MRVSVAVEARPPQTDVEKVDRRIVGGARLQPEVRRQGDEMAENGDQDEDDGGEHEKSTAESHCLRSQTPPIAQKTTEILLPLFLYYIII